MPSSPEWNNQLYFGDNLKRFSATRSTMRALIWFISIRHFNSNASYKVLFREKLGYSSDIESVDGRIAGHLRPAERRVFAGSEVPWRHPLLRTDEFDGSRTLTLFFEGISELSETAPADTVQFDCWADLIDLS